jgi:hypothetical protein
MLGKPADNDHQGEAMSNKRRIITQVAPVTPAQAGLVRRIGVVMVVQPEFYELDIPAQRQVWDCAHELAALDGWVPPLGEANDCLVDDAGVERYPLVPLVA